MEPDHSIVVIGAGFAGIGAAIKLDEAGFSDYVVLEQADGIGGAWHANTYPGVAVDIPSVSYSFSFEPNPDWSRIYAPGAELKAYAEHCVDKYGLRDRIRLDTRVTGAEFDETAHMWRLLIEPGSVITARHVIMANGLLTQPKNPDIAGLDRFDGKIVHTAQWDHDHDVSGKRVAVIGTGASAVQVVPAIADAAETVVVFQRTPIWVIPKFDRAIARSVRSLFRHLPPARLAARFAANALCEALLVLAFHYNRSLPGLNRAIERVCRNHLRDQVPDSALREKLTPSYGFGCKRPTFSNHYLSSFVRDDVELETTPIQEITAHGVRTADGHLHEVDTLILATGFAVFDKSNVPPFPISGVDNTDLSTWYDTNRFQSYQGVSVPGFPNMFTILGPYGFNGTSYFHLIETQMRHIVRCLRHARRLDASQIDVTHEANDRYFASMLRRRRGQVFFNGTCGSSNSYYFDRHGDVPVLRPVTSVEARWRSTHFDMNDYRFEARDPA
ncbi:MAG: flavin-containing monooxygenase [Mycobacterium sp.]